MPANAGDIRCGFSPESGRSPKGGLGNPFQYYCLENLMDRGAWKTTVHGIAKSWTWWSNLAQHSMLSVNSREILIWCMEEGLNPQGIKTVSKLKRALWIWMKDIQETRGHNYFPSYVGQSSEHKELHKYLLLEIFIMSVNTFMWSIFHTYWTQSASFLIHFSPLSVQSPRTFSSWLTPIWSFFSLITFSYSHQTRHTIFFHLF